MAWQEVEGTKPPLQFNEDETAEVAKEVLKTEEDTLALEIKGASLSREEGESLGSKQGFVDENVIFDSKTGYVDGVKKE